ncbi:GntR family transcriptional regulator [Gordonia sp. (in: high G+C Gram-positive bacteria)]|uniref:GntR family transcriptional regulator n=1 Tax=Gordonia sp. (in: high G+C Gram-positive bacteria) TaxID=84139 RepID=UPI002616112A|nr:GntR family transcriptional regulator [Gordonia sp. (in: high G+C Gram-positive bacteria)]
MSSDPEPRITLDDNDPTPAFEQIRKQIVGHIAAGRLPLGAKLPPLRQLARDLGIAVGTAAHAYRELELAGVITTRRGAGTRVASLPDSPAGPPPETERQVRELAVGYLAATAALGVVPSSALDAVVRALQSSEAPGETTR